MLIKFLGVGQKVYSSERGYTSIALINSDGRFSLVDCGAGTLEYLYSQGMNLKNLDRIYITHHHADHIGDMPGILNEIRHHNISIICPDPEDPLITTVLRYSKGNISVSPVCEYLGGGNPHSEDWEFQPITLTHGIQSYGYIFREIMSRPSLNFSRINGIFGVRGGLDRLHNIRNGLRVDPIIPYLNEFFHGDRDRRFSIGFLGDTTINIPDREPLYEVDILVCPTTHYAENLSEAYETNHMTTNQVSQLANELGVGYLICTHISPMKSISRINSEVSMGFDRAYFPIRGENINL